MINIIRVGGGIRCLFNLISNIIGHTYIRSGECSAKLRTAGRPAISVLDVGCWAEGARLGARTLLRDYTIFLEVRQMYGMMVYHAHDRVGGVTGLTLVPMPDRIWINPPTSWTR